MDDKTLIRRIAEGDQHAVRLLVENNRNLVWHIIVSLVGNSSDGEDLFQEVFLRVFKGIRQFRSDSRLSTWIGSIAHHVCVDYLRKKKREMIVQSYDTDVKQIINISTGARGNITEKEDLKKIILAAIARLPRDFRTVITLYHLDECSYRDIAEITGMPDGTVRSYISRGRHLLREILVGLVPDLAEIRSDD
ncbi:MAG: RNA polymerase sigma factor [Bacteroidales bacterium]|nr:RNA polymerase sigma factor [Bacteroidales bacterium]